MNGSYYLVNVNDGDDTIHDPENLDERCNTDDAEGKKRVDTFSAAAMLDRGDAVRCRHCMPEED